MKNAAHTFNAWKILCGGPIHENADGGAQRSRLQRPGGHLQSAPDGPGPPPTSQSRLAKVHITTIVRLEAFNAQQMRGQSGTITAVVNALAKAGIAGTWQEGGRPLEHRQTRVTRGYK
jgi:hypothetical protein